MERIERIEKAIEAMQLNQAKTDAQLAKTDAQLAKTDAQLAKTSKILGNMGFNLGIVAEEFFYYALEENKKLGSFVFDDIELNVKAKNKEIEDEFDIVLYNGDSIGLVEIKHKVHPADIQKLKTSKVDNFRALFPYYADYKIYLGIGGFSISSEIEKLALENGMAVLRQKGELAEIAVENLKQY